MTTLTQYTRQEQASNRAAARSLCYRLLSQALAYPTAEAVALLRDEDVPQAQRVIPWLGRAVAQQVEAFVWEATQADAAALQREHRRVFSHVLSVDCPPCETVYTARHIFQEAQELGDIAGFYRAFGLDLAEKERLDHISIELEFMHLLTAKESYALLHHGASKARLCRSAQREFLRDHLGRWARQFARRLREKAGGGYYACAADLLDRFLEAELARLRVRPEEATVDTTRWLLEPDDGRCGVGASCPLVEFERSEPGGPGTGNGPSGAERSEP